MISGHFCRWTIQSFLLDLVIEVATVERLCKVVNSGVNTGVNVDAKVPRRSCCLGRNFWVSGFSITKLFDNSLLSD